MKRILIVFALLLFTCSLTFAAGPEGDPTKDPRGFQKYSWNTSFEQISNDEPLALLSTSKLKEKNVEIYASLNEENRKKGIVILYFFSEKKLFAGSIIIDKKTKILS